MSGPDLEAAARALHRARPGRPVRVEKRKWDGQVSGRWEAHLVSGPPDAWVWTTPAGTVREHPWTGRAECRVRAEVAMGGLGCWLVTFGLDTDGRPGAAHADAILPVQEAAPGLLAFVDLDLDLAIDLGTRRAVVQDEDDFTRRAARMDYPGWVRAAAWTGLREVERRLRCGAWPFGVPAAAGAPGA